MCLGRMGTYACGRIVVGQDAMVGYSGSDGVHAQLFVSESIVLKLDSPAAVCTIAMAEADTKGSSKSDRG